MKRLTASFAFCVLAVLGSALGASAQCQNGRCQSPSPVLVNPFTFPSVPSASPAVIVEATAYRTAYARAAAGETFVTVFYATDPGLPQAVTPGVYKCELYRGKPSFTKIG